MSPLLFCFFMCHDRNTISCQHAWFPKNIQISLLTYKNRLQPTVTPLTVHLTSGRSLSCFLPCWGRGRCWRLGGRKERQESFREDIREWGTARVSTVRRETNTPVFCSCWICHRIGAKQKCRPVVSLARAGPSRPRRCWSTTQRSYLMTIVPPPEALYSLPLLEVRGQLACFVVDL